MMHQQVFLLAAAVVWALVQPNFPAAFGLIPERVQDWAREQARDLAQVWEQRSIRVQYLIQQFVHCFPVSEQRNFPVLILVYFPVLKQLSFLFWIPVLKQQNFLFQTLFCFPVLKQQNFLSLIPVYFLVLKQQSFLQFLLFQLPRIPVLMKLNYYRKKI